MNYRAGYGLTTQDQTPMLPSTKLKNLRHYPLGHSWAWAFKKFYVDYVEYITIWYEDNVGCISTLRKIYNKDPWLCVGMMMYVLFPTKFQVKFRFTLIYKLTLKWQMHIHFCYRCTVYFPYLNVIYGNKYFACCKASLMFSLIILFWIEVSQSLKVMIKMIIYFN